MARHQTGTGRRERRGSARHACWWLLAAARRRQLGKFGAAALHGAVGSCECRGSSRRCHSTCTRRAFIVPTGERQLRARLRVGGRLWDRAECYVRLYSTTCLSDQCVIVISVVSTTKFSDQCVIVSVSSKDGMCDMRETKRPRN